VETIGNKQILVHVPYNTHVTMWKFLKENDIKLTEYVNELIRNDLRSKGYYDIDSLVD